MHRLLPIVLVVLTACGGEVPRRTQIERVDEPVPVMEGQSVTDEQTTLSIADHRGSILVINVWATWCDPCRDELPAFARAAEAYRDRGVRFLGINYQDDRAAATAWIERDYELPYPSLYDPSGESAALFGFPGLPDTIFVDASGTMRFRAFGELTEQQLRTTLDRMLAT